MGTLYTIGTCIRVVIHGYIVYYWYMYKSVHSWVHCILLVHV